MLFTGKPGLARTCVNRGGPESLIRLPVVPRLEVEEVFRSPVPESLSRWHARPGEIFTVCDPQGDFYRGRLTLLTPSEAGLVVFAPLPFPPESPLHIDLFQALPQRERFELILEKATEIGVSRIVPFSSGHSITLDERDARQRKSHRWPELLVRAAKQCRRATIPELLPVLSWPEALAAAGESERVVVLAERELKRRFRDAVRPASGLHRVALWVGPEGGFSDGEEADMERAGFTAVSLGGRILRTETAAMVGAALVQHLLGDLG